MTLLPARVLPVNDAHGGPFLIRVDFRPTYTAVCVRRESDKKTWSCKVHSIQEILAPSQDARALDLIAVITCLYDGVGYDATFHGAPLELTRREVAFAQPESWTDDNYRLTTRISVRSTANAVVPIAPAAAPVADSAHDAIPVVEVHDDDIIFGLNFTPSSVNIEQLPIDSAGNERLFACLQMVGATFPNAYMNWAPSDNRNFCRCVKDGVYIADSKYTCAMDVEVTLEIVHPKGPALCVLSFGAHTIKPSNTATFQPTAQSDVSHTILQFDVVRISPKGVFQVVMLPGSACALVGSTFTIRELGKVARGVTYGSYDPPNGSRS